MNIIDFFRIEQQRLHSWMNEVINDLAEEDWQYTGKGTNSIGFLFWHCVRTEDNILRLILQGKATIWNEGNYHERLGLPPRAQGTGMSDDDARSFRIPDITLFKEYVGKVWQEYDEYLASIEDGGAALGERMVTIKPLGEMRALQAIGQVSITHLFIHYGEMAHLKGELGKRGQVI